MQSVLQKETNCEKLHLVGCNLRINVLSRLSGFDDATLPRSRLILIGFLARVVIPARNGIEEIACVLVHRFQVIEHHDFPNSESRVSSCLILLVTHKYDVGRV